MLVHVHVCGGREAMGHLVAQGSSESGTLASIRRTLSGSSDHAKTRSSPHPWALAAVIERRYSLPRIYLDMREIMACTEGPFSDIGAER